LPEDLAKLGASVIAQSLLVSNFYFWRTTNYFGGANEEKPLLHTWSLAVEEQFYLIFPIALMAIWAFFNYRLKKREERNLTTECTTEHLGRGEEEQTKFGPKGEGMGTTESKSTGEAQGNAQGTCAGAAFSNPSTSELARDSENTSLNRSAIGPASLQATSNPLRATESLCDATPSTLDPRPSTHLGYQRRWALFWLFAAAALLSFGLSIWGVKAQPFAAFFLLPTRAWELLLGSMLAVLPATAVVRSIAQRDILCLAGLAGIFLPVFFYGEQTPFPGLTALPPCLGTAVLIWANTLPANCVPNQSRFASALSWPPIVFIGLISYSLYLWHWPVICFSSYWAVSEFTAVEKWVIVAFSLGLAVLSWRFIETPFRHDPSKSSRFFYISAAVSSILFITGLFFYAFQGHPSRLPQIATVLLEELKNDSLKRGRYSHIAGNFQNIQGLKDNNIATIGIETDVSPKFILLGDSHAQCMVSIFDEMAREAGVSGVVVTYQGTPPFLKWGHYLEVAPRNAPQFFQEVYDYVSRNKIKNVFLLAYWSQYLEHGGVEDFEHALAKLVQEFQSAGATVWFIQDYPENSMDPVRGLLRSIIFPNLSQLLSRHTYPNAIQHGAKNFKVKEIAKKMDLKILDASQGLFDADTQKFPTIDSGLPIYFDRDHLTIYGARKSLGQVLAPIFKELK